MLLYIMCAGKAITYSQRTFPHACRPSTSSKFLFQGPAGEMIQINCYVDHELTSTLQLLFCFILFYFLLKRWNDQKRKENKKTTQTLWLARAELDLFVYAGVFVLMIFSIHYTMDGKMLVPPCIHLHHTCMWAFIWQHGYPFTWHSFLSCRPKNLTDWVVHTATAHSVDGDANRCSKLK